MKKLLFFSFLIYQTAFSQTPKLIIPTEKDSLYDIKKQKLISKEQPSTILSSKPNLIPNYPSCFEPFINPAANGWIELPRNDDGSYGPVSLGWSFSLFGKMYNSVYINTNGNITFDSPLSQYSSDGFPISKPMIAAFWSDIDTRNTNSGSIWYKLFSDRLVITWDRVGYYNQKVDKFNTFQMTIKANTASNFTGNDVVFAYDDMQWTTGDASNGANGFGGLPATVGANRGDNLNYIQTGRFNLNGSAAPNVPSGAYGGVDWLDGKCIGYQVKGTSGSTNISPAVAGLPTNNQFLLNSGDTRNLLLQFSGPEVNQNVNITTSLSGLCNTIATITNNNSPNPSILLTVTGASCNIGTNNITITANDNGSPVASQTFTISVVVNPCQENVQMYNVTDDIVAGTNIINASMINGKIIATNRILNTNTRATYIAKSISLNSGFKVEQGAVFNAEIGGCN